MKWNSRNIVSSQKEPHPSLEKIVKKHMQFPYQKPIHPGSVETLEKIMPILKKHSLLILDSGCGVGESTIHIARNYPDALILGIDKSEKRIRKNEFYRSSIDPNIKNYMIIRGNLVDLWRLMVDHGIKLYKHYLLYPNPWPKAEHVMRRWHAHPVFPFLLELGGELILRSNWQIYVQEFAIAVEIMTGKKAVITSIQPETFISPFEKKYFLSGHTLYELKVNLI